jgi:hypothetical protein
MLCGLVAVAMRDELCVLDLSEVVRCELDGDNHGRTCDWAAALATDSSHALLLARLRAADEIEWSRAIADSSQVQAKNGAPQRARAPWTEADRAPSTISSSTRAVSLSPGA